LPVKPPVPTREKLVATIAALTLAYTAWGFGGVIAWSLHLMLLGGLLTFALAFAPLPAFRIAPFDWRFLPFEKRAFQRLWRSPAFYFSSAFLAYLAIGALNPAWQIVSDDRGWWLQAVTPPLASWLPTSVESSYEPMNAWRIFNMHLAAFSLALGVWLGLGSRRALLFVIWTFVLSSSAMAVVAIIQKEVGSNRVLFLMESENRYLWGSFFYRNQAVAYLNWALVVCGCLYFYHAHRARVKGNSGGPHFLNALLVALLLFSVASAFSRAGLIIGVLLVTIFIGVAIVNYFSSLNFSQWGLWLLGSALVLTLAMGIGWALKEHVDWSTWEKRFGSREELFQEIESGQRVEATKATYDMFQDERVTGWGAGSFRYVFPMYQQNYPDLFYSDWLVVNGVRGRDFFRYAHNDIFQFLAEYGIVGTVMLVLALFSFLWRGISIRAIPGMLLLMGGVVAMAGHAFFDFIFHSASVWVAFVGGTAAMTRLMDLDR